MVDNKGNTDFEGLLTSIMSEAKLMLGNAVEISLIFRWILGPLVLGWAPNHFVLGAQLAPGEKRLVCIPETCYQVLWKCIWEIGLM